MNYKNQKIIADLFKFTQDIVKEKFIYMSNVKIVFPVQIFVKLTNKVQYSCIVYSVNYISRKSFLIPRFDPGILFVIGAQRWSKADFIPIYQFSSEILPSLLCARFIPRHIYFLLDSTRFYEKPQTSDNFWLGSL